MKNLRKKGDKYFDISFLAVMIFVLLILLATVYIKTGKLTKDLGDIQKNILDTYYEAEKTLFFIDQSAKHSAEQAIYELGQKGGFKEKSGCGDYYDYVLWNSEDEECYPNVKEEFKASIDGNMDSYIGKYPIIPRNNYEYLIKEDDDKITLYGFAIRDIGLDVKDWDKKTGKPITDFDSEDVYFDNTIPLEIYYDESRQNEIEFTEFAYGAAKESNVNYLFVKSIIEAETHWRMAPKNPWGAVGIMQMIESTAKNLGCDKNWDKDPKSNIDCGVKYIDYLINDQREKGLTPTLGNIAAAYNCGEKAYKITNEDNNYIFYWQDESNCIVKDPETSEEVTNTREYVKDVKRVYDDLVKKS